MRRAPLVAAATLLLIGAAPMSAHAVTAADASAAANSVAQAALVPAGWTGSAATCDAGTESTASLDATLQAVNAFRAVAGLPPVTLDANLSRQALSAALMMKAAGNLSHDPDASWPCYSADGDSAAGRSNLALGSSGAAAIRLYVADEGVAGLGHRRWVLDPAATAFGSGSTGSSNALTVIGGPSQLVASGTQVAWPPAGAIAPAWVPSTWSVSVGGTSDNVGLTDPAVTMTLDGAPVSVGGVSDLGTGYGTGRAIGWVPAIDRATLRTGYHEIVVSVAGVSVNGAPQAVTYTTTVGTPPAPTPTPTPIPATASSAKPSSTSATSVTLPPLRPRIARSRGLLRPGTHLTASFRQGTGRIVTRIAWLRDGETIKRADAVRLRITPSDRGHRLRVKMWSQSRTGTSPLVETSAAVKIPRRLRR